MPRPSAPKIYHILHVDRLPSVLTTGGLLSDSEIGRQQNTGTVIGMNDIKERRLTKLTLSTRPGLFVGECVPFYFCPRSVMLYVIWQANHQSLAYRGGEDPIVHLEADLKETVEWADAAGQRWAFTLSNAGSYVFEDRCTLDSLDDINWNAVAANRWSGQGVQSSVREGKQAEFLLERLFAWSLVRRIGVKSAPPCQHS